MPAAALPRHELLRLSTLHDYKILDTPAEPVFARLVRLASLIMKAELALVSLVDGDRQWFKAVSGDFRQETTRTISFCSHALHSDAALVVPDARRDARFADNVLVTSGRIRFYAGVPLVAVNGMRLGTICAIDSAARKWPTPEQVDALHDLAALAMSELDLRRIGRVWRERALDTEQRINEIARSRGRLESAYRVHTEFLASLSPALRAPLQAMIGEGDPALSATGAVAESGDAPSHLSLSRQGLVSLVVGATSLVEDLAFRRKVDVTVFQDVEDLHVEVDPVRFEQAMLQVMTDAVRAVPEGGCVDIRLIRDAGRAVLSIRSEAVHLTPVQVAQALTPLSQPCAEGGEGTGLGLPIARMFVERQGGTFEMRSDLDATTVRISLPLP